MFLRLLVLLCLFSLSSACVPVSEVATTEILRPEMPQTVNLTPTTTKYSFIENDDNVGMYSSNLFKNNNFVDSSSIPALSAKITSPVGYVIKFENSLNAVSINDTTTFRMIEGVYPFTLTKPGDKGSNLSGAIAVFNVDKTLELATFGLTEETLLFNPEMIKQAESGVLASYTISFDGKNVMHYWLGNREDTAPATRNAVELDFTRNTNIKSLKIAGKDLNRNKVTLDVPSGTLKCVKCEKVGPRSAFRDRCPKSGAHQIQEVGWAKVDYPIEFELKNGQRFKGYVRKLGRNAYTSFLSIPCDIPENLLELASKGTIAKLSVFTSQDNRYEIAEIVFGLAR